MWILSFGDFHRFLADGNGYTTGGRAGMAIGKIRTRPRVMTAESARPSRVTTPLGAGEHAGGVCITGRCGVCSLAHRLAVRRNSMYISEFPPRLALATRTTNPRQTRGEAMRTTFEATKG